MDYTSYPPIIEGTIPAFTSRLLKVPITHNPGVNLNSVIGYSLKLRYINNNLILNQEGKSTIEVYGNFLNDNIIPFDLRGEASKGTGEEEEPYANSFVTYKMGKVPYYHLINRGDYFKIQIAYIFEGNKIGSYSSIGVTKRCGVPTIQIKGLNKDGLNRLTKVQSFEGLYTTNDKDPDERLYSWQMSLYNEANELVETSDKKLFFASQNLDLRSQAINYTFYTTIEENKIYKIQFSGITINGLQISSPLYQLMEINTIDWKLGGKFWATMNKEYGYISLCIDQELKDEFKYIQPGKYFITRKSSKDNYNSLLPIGTITIESSRITETPEFFRDYNIEQGVSYKYYLQQFNNYKIYSSPIYAKSEKEGEEQSAAEIYCDFEDIFLYDGEKQLRIKFNPQISSFKTTKLEQKTDTIGGKYPFFFSNRQVGYKEFPIGGLISYFMDEEFCSRKELGLKDENPREKTPTKIITNKLPTHNLIGYNLAAERNFKLKVLDWLNNGSYKLFKSPTEGNYIVRLMNVSLTPNEQLGRMLHSFQATAYECLDNNYENLIQYGFHKLIDITEYADINVSYSLRDLKKNSNGWYTLTPNNFITKELVCRDFQEGDLIKISFSNGEENEIVIGPIGGYQLRSIDNLLIEKIMVKKYVQSSNPSGTIDYVGKMPKETKFDKLKDVKFHTLIAKKYKNLSPNLTPFKEELNPSYYHGSKKIVIKDEPKSSIINFKSCTSLYWEIPKALNKNDFYTFEIDCPKDINNLIGYIETYEGNYEQINEDSVEIIENLEQNYHTLSFNFNISELTAFKRGMIHFDGNFEIKSWSIYSNKLGNLTNEIRKEYPNSEILKFYLVQFIVENPEDNKDGCEVRFNEEINLTFNNNNFPPYNALDQINSYEDFTGTSINLFNRRHLELYLNLERDPANKEEKIPIPIITMGNKVTAYVTALLQQEVYENV